MTEQASLLLSLPGDEAAPMTISPRPMRRLLLALAALLSFFLAPAAVLAAPAADPNDVQTAWRLLDYMAVDYGGAVKGGRIKSASEYAEMTEFAGSVSSKLATLPPKPERAALLAGATRLQGVIAAKGTPRQVATLAHGLAADLLQAYPVPLAPVDAPNVARGASLFPSTCAACHGGTGNGRGPDAAKLGSGLIAS